MSIWEFEEGCLDPSVLKVGDRLQVKSKYRLLKSYGDDWENYVKDQEEDCLDYLIGGQGFKPLDILIIIEIKEEIHQKYANYIPVHLICPNNNKEIWFVCSGYEYMSDNITFNEMLEVINKENKQNV
jgi:hypothetical protein